MYTETLETVVQTVLKKKELMNRSLPRYFAAAALAGAYVGLGIALLLPHPDTISMAGWIHNMIR